MKPWGGSCPMCRGQISLYTTVTLSNGAPLRTPDTDSIFGETYLQGGIPGLAAYHFDSESDCYVSYAKARP